MGADKNNLKLEDSSDTPQKSIVVLGTTKIHGETILKESPHQIMVNQFPKGKAYPHTQGNPNS